LKPEIKKLQVSGFKCQVGSGVLVSDLLDFCIGKGLSGLEWAGGLPGTVGGAIRGNAGAFGGEMKNVIESVVSLDISQTNSKIIKRSGLESLFDYRSSIFKRTPGKEIIFEATLKLEKGNQNKIEEEMNKNINYRLVNHPLEYPSLGSTFKNVPRESIKTNIENMPIKKDPFEVVPAAYFIAEAGLRGVSSGGAMISPKHPNFIVNVLEATSEDVKNLIKLVKNEIKKKFGVELEEEIEYLKSYPQPRY